MRWTSWIFAAAVIGMASPAAGYQPGYTSCNGGMAGLDAGACASPAGYCLTPGCCEDTRHCCDNAWAGYCDHRAKIEAFWARVGTPAAYARSRPCRQAPMSSCDSCPTPAMQPTPAAPSSIPMPAPPAPAKAAWNPYNSRR